MNHDPLDELIAHAARVRDGDLHAPAINLAAMALMEEITSMETPTGNTSVWAPTPSSTEASAPAVEPQLGEYLPSGGGAHRPKRWQRTFAVSIAAAAVVGAVIVGVDNSGTRDRDASTVTEPQAPAAAPIETPSSGPPVTIDGVTVTYVPEGMVAQPVHSDPRDPTGTSLRLVDRNDPDPTDVEGPLFQVNVLRGPEADEATVMAEHWFGDTAPTPITVQGAPAYAIHAIGSDGQEEQDRRIVWFPQPELAIFVTSADLPAPTDFDDFVEGLEASPRNGPDVTD